MAPRPLTDEQDTLTLAAASAYGALLSACDAVDTLRHDRDLPADVDDHLITIVDALLATADGFKCLASTVAGQAHIDEVDAVPVDLETHANRRSN